MPSYRWAVQESEGYKWRHFLKYLLLFILHLPPGGQNKSRKIINDDILLLLVLFFILHFLHKG